MTVVGVLLVLVAALILIAVLVGGSNDPAALDMGLFDVSTSTMGVFLIGAATVLIFVSGLELLRSGVRRSLRRRRELKHARAVVARHDQQEHRGDTPQAGAGTRDEDVPTTAEHPAPAAGTEPAPGSDAGTRDTTR